MTRKLLTLAGLTSIFGMAALMTITLSSCKNDDTTVTPQATVVNVTMEGDEIEMTHTLHAGPTKFVVVNTDTISHRFEAERETGGAEVQSKLLAPNGGTDTVSVDLVVDGYEFYCPEAPRAQHKDHGEKVEFDVVQ